MDEQGVPARELSDEQLEQEYLRRHPKRTWQGAAGDEPVEVDEATRLRSAVRGLMTQMEALLAGGQETTETPERNEKAEVDLLRVVAAAPQGRMHRLEVHQAARRAGLSRALLAQMYRAQPPLLRAEGHDRVITDEGRARAGV